MRTGSVLLLILSLLLPGCGGGSDMPELAQVTGVVTLDGEPLPDAIVYFYPTEGGKGSSAITDADGRYELVYGDDIKGAMIGPCSVSITTFAEAVYDEAGEKILEKEKPERVAPDFNDITTLLADVGPGENVFDFDVTARE